MVKLYITGAIPVDDGVTLVRRALDPLADMLVRDAPEAE